jgi:hypothetical protein
MFTAATNATFLLIVRGEIGLSGNFLFGVGTVFIVARLSFPAEQHKKADYAN